MKSPRAIFNNLFSKIHIRESPKERYHRLFQTVIKEVSKDEMFIALARIKGNTCDWYSTLNPPSHPDIERHNTFIAVSHEIEEIYQDIHQINTIKFHRYFICLVQGTPIGVMTFVTGSTSFYNEGVDKIGFMLTHPGSQGGGSLFVEKAVELSCNLGNGGELQVSAKPYAVSFYKSLGFEPYGFPDFETTSMVLNPSERNEWSAIGNIYRLRKYTP
ncbi:GNAT family N-acetyltransferase [Xenorhabdus lircayensis]|uniref:GNAT family N-acetyltransferase n=1 Tax=Xenorhabdus lircayensis TaxID=2763499 RepID=A0ABS0U7Z1_9GAMM|nr:GNAT family N-acetyltransferase [Xenorhabdus lircayensis]MBI6550003.1 GNAT family N-acetyltransferase [Xenorhabdus lircayensis]